MNEKTARRTKIAIIGAGVAGLYCGYRLDMEGESDFLIAEASSHIGGRIWTTRILENGEFVPDDKKIERSGEDGFKFGKEKIEFCAEFGPMRIEVELQKYLHCVLKRLDLDKDLEPFPPYQSPTSTHDPQYEMKGEEAEQDSPLDLLQLAIVRILGRLRLTAPQEPVQSDEAKGCRAELQGRLEELFKALSQAAGTRQTSWKPVLLQWIDARGERDYQHIREYGLFEDAAKRETYLWNMGFWNLLSEVLSHHALTKLRDLGTFYHLIPENPNAAEWLIFWLRALRTSNQLAGIRGGMQRITESLWTCIDPEKIRSKSAARIRKKLKLIGLKPAGENGQGVALTFQKTDEAGEVITGEEETWVADHVILALPSGPLRELARRNADRFDDQLPRDLASVFGFPLVKVFFAFKERWWDQSASMTNRYATLIPTRELHYWATAMSNKALVMVYTDRPASSFWSNYIQHGTHCREDAKSVVQGGSEDSPSGIQIKPEQGDPAKNPRLINTALRYLGEYGVKRTPRDVLYYGIRDWGREPYLGAAHSWYPERKSWEHLNRLAAFAMIPDGGKAKESSEAPRNIHVCGEAYSDYQAFIEGALRSSEHVLHKIDSTMFPQTPTPWLCAEKCTHDHHKPEMPARFAGELCDAKKAPHSQRARKRAGKRPPAR